MRYLVAVMVLASGCASRAPAAIDVVLTPVTDEADAVQPPCGPISFDYVHPATASGETGAGCMRTFTHHWEFNVVGAYDLTLFVPAQLATAGAMAAGAETSRVGSDRAGIRLAGFPCSEWGGSVAWVPGDGSWSVEVNAICADDGTTLQAFFASDGRGWN